MIKDITVSALCDIDKNVLHTLGKSLNIENLHADYDVMLDNEELDGLVVASYPTVHFDVCKKAIQKGIPIFVEKPPVKNMAELEYLLNLLEKKFIPTAVGMNFSYAEPLLLIKNIVNKKDFGEIDHLSIKHYSSKPQTPFWDLDSITESFLLAQLIHPLDFSLDMCGDFTDIHVFKSKQDRPLFLQIVIQFKNGTIGSIESGTGSPHFLHNVEVLGSNSVIVRSNHLWQVEIFNKDKRTNFIDNAKLWSSSFTPSPLSSGYKRTGYLDELTAFTSAIKTGDPVASRDIPSMQNTFYALDIIRRKL